MKHCPYKRGSTKTLKQTRYDDEGRIVEEIWLETYSDSHCSGESCGVFNNGKCDYNGYIQTREVR